MNQHKEDCKMAFGRKDATCPRCQDLLSGKAKPVKGWGAAKKEREEQFRRELRAHDCKKSNCGPVCTFCEW